MINETKFDNEFVTEIKKKIINYSSHSNANINKITYNLTLYTKFVVNAKNTQHMSVKLPEIVNGKIIPAEVSIDLGFFDVEDNTYYIKPEIEDIFTVKFITILLNGSTINIKYEGIKPVEIIENQKYLAYSYSLATCIAEEIIEYVIPDFADKYAFNKKIVRMVNAIIGKKYGLNFYFKQDDSLNVMIYSQSNDNELLSKIDKYLLLIYRLITTSTVEEAVVTSNERNVINKAVNNYKSKLINILIDELYIPFINSVGFDPRKAVRDEILKGFLGSNYVNLKLNDDNKDSYYWASLINNTVPINNKVSDKQIELLKEQVLKEDANNMHDLYVINALNKAKNDIKYFFVFTEKGKIIIKTSTNRVIKEPHLVEEILSYSYINSIDSLTRKKLEVGIINLCEKKDRFKCSLKSTPLNNKMLVACIIQLARKNGYTIEIVGDIEPTKVEFDVTKREEVK